MTRVRPGSPKPVLVLLVLALALPPTASAATSRELLPAGAGPQRLEPDAPLVAASARGDLSDLRLHDAAGLEVPYLLVPPVAPAGEWIPSRLLPIRATKKESGFEADLGAVRSVSKLRLDGLPEPFLKRFRLEGSGDRTRWTLLVPEGTVFALPDEGLRQLEAAFERGEYRYLRMTWDDRSSGRVPAPRAVGAWEPATRAPAPTPLRVPLAVARRESEPGLSRFALRIPGPHLPVTAVVLDAKGERLLRLATVSEARLGDGRLEPRSLGAELLRRVVREGAEASALRIPIARPEELELELRVEDGDNGPLALEGAWGELAPLPWIYFESPDGGPVTATLGDPERRAPRYDLEALRPKLDGVRTGMARLAPAAASPARPAAAASPAPALAPGGALDVGAFRYRREIGAAEPGLAAVRLDAAVLARSPVLADVRIAAPGGRQVPYLLERRDEPLSLPLAPPARASAPELARPGTTLYVLELPETSLPDARLVLATASRVFERTVELWSDGDGSRRRPHRHLAAARWAHALPERPAPELTLPLPALDARRVYLLVDDGDNAPLRIDSARLLLPAWRLRFFHPGGPVALLYGAEELPPPRYDLALLAPRLRSAPARELPVAQAATDRGPGDAPGRRGRIAFWAVLGLTVAALLGLLGRLLRAGGGDASP